MIHYINIEEQIIYFPPQKQFWVTGLGLWLVNHYTIVIHHSGSTYNIAYIKSNSCSENLLSLHSPGVIQRNFPLELHIHSLE